jgi:hypothetical protein
MSVVWTLECSFSFPTSGGISFRGGVTPARFVVYRPARKILQELPLKLLSCVRKNKGDAG